MKTTLTLVIVLLIAVGGYFIFAETTKAPTTTPTTMTDTNVQPAQTQSPVSATPQAQTATTPSVKPVMVTYDGTSFSPNTVTIHVGDQVTFVSSGSAPMWVASDAHPAHTGYSGTTKDQHCPDTTGTAFDQCSTGTSYTFTFAKAGSWGYHNHANHNAKGTIVVN